MAQSTFDRRRVNGPEQTYPPSFEDSTITPPLRVNRSTAEIRPIFLQAGIFAQGHGSAYIETERTKIACTVYGPRQAKSTSYSDKGRLHVEVKFAPFACQRRRAPLRDAEDRSISNAILQSLSSSVLLELFPKSIIDVFVLILEADGLAGCVASGTIAASTALADAKVEMYGLVTSCAACFLDSEVFLDPSELEEDASESSVVFSGMAALGSVTSIWQNGRMSPRQLEQGIAECEAKCIEIHSVVAQSLLESVNRREQKI